MKRSWAPGAGLLLAIVALAGFPRASAEDVVLIHLVSPPDGAVIDGETESGQFHADATFRFAPDPAYLALAFKYRLQMRAPTDRRFKTVATGRSEDAVLNPATDEYEIGIDYTFPAELWGVAARGPVQWRVRPVSPSGRQAEPSERWGFYLNALPVVELEASDTVATRAATLVRITATVTDEDDQDGFIYRWSFVDKPVGSANDISGFAGPVAEFTPDTDTDGVHQYVVRLEVDEPPVPDFGNRASPGASAEITIEAVNRAPVPEAGPNLKNRLRNQPVSLNASFSDENGDGLSKIKWKFLATPETSGLANGDILGADTLAPTFTPDRDGEYQLRLKVVDDDPVVAHRLSGKDTVSVFAVNGKPTVSLGDHVVGWPKHVELMLSATFADPNGDQPAKAKWRSLPESPTTPELIPDGQDPLKAGFTASASGDYHLKVKVKDNDPTKKNRLSDGDRMIVSVMNAPPVADAGQDLVSQPFRVTAALAGGFSDPDGDGMGWARWAFVSVPPGSILTDADLANADTLTPSFVPDVKGTYVLSLTVADDDPVSPLTDSDTVEVVAVNAPPQPDAGDDVQHPRNVALTLHGSYVDPNGQGLSAIQWTFTSVPAGSTLTDGDIANATTLDPTFTPDRDGSYELELRVTDDDPDDPQSGTDDIVVTAINVAPAPDAGSDVPNQPRKNSVTLNGSFTDVNGDGASQIDWGFVSVPPGSSLTDADIIYGPKSLSVSFTPDADGDYELELSVQDDDPIIENRLTGTDRVVVTAINVAPVVEAGADVPNHPRNTVVSLSGSFTDVNGDGAASAEWVLLDKPPLSAVQDGDIPNTLATQFTPDADGLFVLQLTVTDDDAGQPESGSDTVTVTVVNSAPVVDAGVDVTNHPRNTSVTLAGSFTDPNGDGASAYEWTFVLPLPVESSLTDADIVNAHTTNPSFAPDVDATFTLRFTVTDDDVEQPESGTDDINVTAVNVAPVAEAGADVPDHPRNATVSLAGSFTDTNGDGAASVEWTLVDKPPLSLVETGDIVNADTLSPSFTPDVTGDFKLQLLVEDNDPTVANRLPGTDTVTVTAVEKPPVVDAGEDFTTPRGVLTTLSGTASDLNDDPLTILWTFKNLPPAPGSLLTNGDINDPDTTTPSFTPDVNGAFELEMTVSDGTKGKLLGSDSVTVTAANTAPVPSAGDDVDDHPRNTPLQLAGSFTDENGDRLAVTDWKLVDKPTRSSLTDNDITDRDTLTPTFTPDWDGHYELELSVIDDDAGQPLGGLDVVAVKAVNVAPVVDAGGPVADHRHHWRVALAGSFTDGNGDGASETGWSFDYVAPGSALTDDDISGATGLNASFVPDLDGEYRLTLSVKDDDPRKKRRLTGSDALTVTVINVAPVADAGRDQNRKTGDLVLLDGSGSNDENGDLLTFAWSFVTYPGSTEPVLNDDTLVRPEFTPGIPGTYVARLQVDDGLEVSNIDSVTIQATNSVTNGTPVAHAGRDQHTKLGPKVVLDGRESYDPDPDALVSFTWSLISRPGGSGAVLSSAAEPAANFEPDLVGTYVAQLVVDDGAAQSAPDEVSITVTDGGGNAIPVADAGLPHRHEKLAPFVLDGSGSADADGDDLAHHWILVRRPLDSGVVAGLPEDDLGEQHTFAPDVAGQYAISLLVGDGGSRSAPAPVVMTITPFLTNAIPMADAGPDQAVAVVLGVEAVTLDGSGSRDADTWVIPVYTWAFVSVPAGSALTTADIQDNGSVDASFVPDVAGQYLVRLWIMDAPRTVSEPDTVLITVSSQ